MIWSCSRNRMHVLKEEEKDTVSTYGLFLPRRSWCPDSLPVRRTFVLTSAASCTIGCNCWSGVEEGAADSLICAEDSRVVCKRNQVLKEIEKPGWKIVEEWTWTVVSSVKRLNSLTRWHKLKNDICFRRTSSSTIVLVRCNCPMKQPSIFGGSFIMSSYKNCDRYFATSSAARPSMKWGRISHQAAAQGSVTWWRHLPCTSKLKLPSWSNGWYKLAKLQMKKVGKTERLREWNETHQRVHAVQFRKNSATFAPAPREQLFVPLWKLEYPRNQ